MRKVFVIILVLIVLGVGYAVWPFFGLFGLVRAIEARDVTAATERVDLRAVQRSFVDQLVQTYLQATGRDRLNPLAQNLVSGAAATAIEPVIARLLSPAALVDLLRNGWPVELSSGRAGGFSGVSSANLGTVWQLYVNSRYGFGTFQAFVPAELPQTHRFGLGLRLKNWTWKLDGIELPQQLRIAIVQEILQRHPEQK
jgi:hypothetical protein